MNEFIGPANTPLQPTRGAEEAGVSGESVGAARG